MINFITNFAAACQPKGDFFGLPTWYKYLPGENLSDGGCAVQIGKLSEVWLILAAILELLLRLAAVAAIAMIVYGGVMFIMSEGNPDKTKKALGTVINACVGLAIAVVSAAMITFVAGRIN